MTLDLCSTHFTAFHGPQARHSEPGHEVFITHSRRGIKRAAEPGSDHFLRIGGTF